MSHNICTDPSCLVQHFEEPDKIVVEQLSREFSITKGKYRMTVKVKQGKDGGKRLSIEGLRYDKTFVFMNSRSEVVEAIGELLIEASKL
jgi:hypothetical protein